MNFDFTEGQKILKKSARDFLDKEYPRTMVKEMAADRKGYDIQLWNQMADMGWMGLNIPEEYGGMGMPFLDLIVLIEEMGRAVLYSPYFSTIVLGANIIMKAGSRKQKKELLPKIAEGKLIMALALNESNVSYEPDAIKLTADLDGDHYVLNGTKLFAENAHIADYIITVARTKAGISLFLVDSKSKGLNTRLLNTIAGDKQCQVRFKNVRVPAENMLGKSGRGYAVIKDALERAAVAVSALMLGGAEATLEMSVAYAKDRVQFGVPIGFFQAVQHHCSNMKIAVETCRMAVYEAAWMVSQGMPASAQVSMTKAWVEEAYADVVEIGHRIHGGIGYCMDHNMPLYTKQQRYGAAFYGNSPYHLEKVAANLKL